MMIIAAADHRERANEKNDRPSLAGALSFARVHPDAEQWQANQGLAAWAFLACLTAACMSYRHTESR